MQEQEEAFLVVGQQSFERVVLDACGDQCVVVAPEQIIDHGFGRFRWQRPCDEVGDVEDTRTAIDRLPVDDRASDPSAAKKRLSSRKSPCRIVRAASCSRVMRANPASGWP